MFVLLKKLSKPMVSLRNSRQQQNRVLDYTRCAVITIASVSDALFLVQTGSEKYRKKGFIFVLYEGDVKFLPTPFIVLINELYC